jgi:uncharacterized repeat protein (TIGR03803 family)
MMRTDRRVFIKRGLVAAGGLGLGLSAWSRLGQFGAAPAIHPALGALFPTNDQTTGLPLLMLPKGYRYRSMAWAGEKLNDGYQSPAACDGMGVVAEQDGIVTLIRNHELRGSSGAIGDAGNAWDNTGGGTSTLLFDSASEQLTDSRISLNGTLNNCAGGVTPWGTWLSCEEAPVTPELKRLGGDLKQKTWKIGKARKNHGYVFEVHPQGESEPKPILAMGQFYHEAAAVDPETSIVYMTEDTSPNAGFYRYVPNVPRKLQAGGRLQMLKVDGHKRLDGPLPLNNPMTFDWVDIKDPERGHTPGSHDGAGVVNQGLQAGGSAFVALEGCIHHQGLIYFTSKAGGSAGAGQVFRLDIAGKTVELIFEASAKGSFSGPDNIVISPQESLIICEDRLGLSTRAQYIAGLDEKGSLFAFCQINPDLKASFAGHKLHRTVVKSEWAGACFSADKKWMFVNIYNPGVTLAITGPWLDGPV